MIFIATKEFQNRMENKNQTNFLVVFFPPFFPFLMLLRCLPLFEVVIKCIFFYFSLNGCDDGAEWMETMRTDVSLLWQKVFICDDISLTVWTIPKKIEMEIKYSIWRYYIHRCIHTKHVCTKEKPLDKLSTKTKNKRKKKLFFGDVIHSAAAFNTRWLILCAR